MQSNLVRVRSLGRFMHNGMPVKPGDIIELSEDDAAAMCSRAMGLAERVLDEEPKRAYRRRDLKAEDE